MLRSTDARYGVITRILHWIVALIIIGLIWLGWWMVDLSYYDRWYKRALELHKSLGMAVLAIAAVKIAWVIHDGKPRFPESIAPFERSAATATHHLLFLLMLLIPATGYVISTSAGDGISVFGLFEAPAVSPVSETIRDLAIELHFWLAYCTGALVMTHALAALKHQFIDRDGTLRRILW
jgi:cytochrome b561